MNETKAKLGRLREQMAARRIDLVAIGPTANMRYFLGFVPHPDERLCLLLVTAGDARLVVPAVNAEGVAAHTDLPLQRWPDEDGPAAALGRALAEAGISAGGRLSVDGAMRADFALPLLAAAAPVESVTAESLVGPLRLLKSAAEIAGLARAAAQADRAMAAGAAACVPGATEAEVSWAIESAFRQDGAESVDFAIVASGPNGAYPHHSSGDRQLQRGDLIILDIGATLDGYKSDITRVVSLGRPAPDVQAIYDVVLAANASGRAAVRPGATAGEVDAATRGTIARAGFGDHFVHRTGHGIGLDGHEPPWIASGSKTILAEGMIHSIEPGIYLPGRLGIRIEDIVAVTPDGARVLTGFDHDLIVKD